MQGISTFGTTATTQGQAATQSRRPGTAGHPGKHLGQLKHQPPQPDDGSLPLVQQQLNALNSGSRNQPSSGGNQSTAQQNDLFYAMALDALRSTGNNISNQLDFTGKLNAITTVL